MDLLMVCDRASGRLVYVEQMERGRGETPREYTRRSVRREGQIRILYPGEAFQILAGWAQAPSKSS